MGTDTALGALAALGAPDMLASIPRWQIYLALAILALAGGGTWFYINFLRPYHFATVHDNVLYRDGFRSVREFDLALSKSQAKTVILLLDLNELGKKPYADELTLISRTSIRPLSIPIKLGGYPNTKQVQDFLNFLSNSRNHPALIHCAQGIRRTGMMVAAYQMSVLGWDKEKAKSAILAFGHSERSIGDIKRWIDIYDPQKREVTADLGQSTE